MIYVLGVSQHSLLVVPRVEPVLEDLSDEFRREEGRFEDRRDPRDMGLGVSLESARGDDSEEVLVFRAGVYSRYRGTGAEE